MKCSSCGAEIGLTDKVCSHCGRVISETAGYRADLEYYRGDSARTKKKVRTVLAGNIPLVISAVVMILLLIADGVLIYVQENAYHFREDAARKESVRQYGEYSAILQDYLNAGDYTGFTAFMECHSIAEWEKPYDDLKLVCQMAKDYSSMVSALESASMFGPNARRYTPEDDIRTCQREIRDFHHAFEYNLSEIDEDPYREIIYDMKAKADLMLEVYLGLDEDGRDRYFAESDIRQEAYLEEVLMHD